MWYKTTQEHGNGCKRAAAAALWFISIIQFITMMPPVSHLPTPKPEQPTELKWKMLYHGL